MKDYSFGNFICELRQRNGLSQFQLGTLVGVSNKAVSKWENGFAKPKIATCHKLALVLGVSVDELLACKYHTPATAEKGIFAMKKELWKKAEDLLHAHYGQCPHVSIMGRYETERQLLLDSDLIVHFGFLAKLAERSRAEGAEPFIFGNINSSFVAWLLGIIPVNPLEPHYYCPACGTIEFRTETADGWDLPEKKCSCGHRMERDGHSIPCESALMRLKRQPCFDLNLPPSMVKCAGKMLQEHYADASKAVEILLKDQPAGLPISRFVLIDSTADGITRSSVLHMTFEEYMEQYGKGVRYNFITSINADAMQRLCRKTNRSPDKVDFLDKKVMHLYSGIIQR